MLVKLFGLFDLIGAIILLLLIWNFSVPNPIIIFFGIFILIKGIIFMITKDIASIIDIYTGIILLLILRYNPPSIYLIVGCFLLLQKGIISFM